MSDEYNDETDINPWQVMSSRTSTEQRNQQREKIIDLLESALKQAREGTITSIHMVCVLASGINNAEILRSARSEDIPLLHWTVHRSALEMIGGATLEDIEYVE